MPDTTPLANAARASLANGLTCQSKQATPNAPRRETFSGVGRASSAPRDHDRHFWALKRTRDAQRTWRARYFFLAAGFSAAVPAERVRRKGDPLEGRVRTAGALRLRERALSGRRRRCRLRSGFGRDGLHRGDGGRRLCRRRWRGRRRGGARCAHPVGRGRLRCRRAARRGRRAARRIVSGTRDDQRRGSDDDTTPTSTRHTRAPTLMPGFARPPVTSENETCDAWRGGGTASPV